MKRIAFLAVLFASVVFAIPVIASANTISSAVTVHTVSAGETLSKIAKQYSTSYQKICTMNKLRHCGKIRIGQSLKIHGATSGSKQNGQHSIRHWTHTNRDPLVRGPGWVIGKNVELLPVQRTRLLEMGISMSEIEQVNEYLRTGQCHLINRPVGYVWDGGMAMHSGNWGSTENRTGKDIAVLACPVVGGTHQIDLPLGCGNAAYANVVIPPQPVVVPIPSKEEAIACQKIASAWGEVSETGVSGLMRIGCLFQVSKRVQVGPTAAIGASRFSNGDWIDNTEYAGVGIETRVKNVAGLDTIELVVMVADTSNHGVSADRLTRKLEKDGMDLRIAAQFRKRFKIDKETAITVRFMPGVTVPLTNNQTDITWRGEKVHQERSRHVSVSAMLRFELHKVGLNFKPELSLGIWSISDIENPVGGKILAGISTLDDVWRVGVGIHLPHPTWVIEVEWNPGLGWLQLNSKVAASALTNGAVSSREALGLEPSVGHTNVAYAKSKGRNEVSSLKQTPESRTVVKNVEKSANDGYWSRGGHFGEDVSSSIPMNAAVTSTNVVKTVANDSYWSSDRENNFGYGT